MARKGRKGKQPADSQPAQSNGWRSSGNGYRLGGSEPAADRLGSSAWSGRAPPVASDSHGGWTPAGLRRVREGGQGNCLFHSIARQVLGDTELCSRARTEICDWMQAYLAPSAVDAGRCPLTDAHRNMVQNQRADAWRPRDGDAALLRYIKKMRRDGEWGTGLEALCAAYLYRRPVYIWNPDGAAVLSPPQERCAAGVQIIRLLHNGRNHWDSAFPVKDDADGEDAALQAALQASLHDFNLTAGGACSSTAAPADGYGKHSASGNRLGGASTELTVPEADEERGTQRALAASAALARFQQSEERGLGEKERAAEMRQAREKSEMLGKLAERCERRREIMPLGAGLMSLEQLRAAVQARAPNVSIDGVELTASRKATGSAQLESTSAGSETSGGQTAAFASTSRNRWNRRAAASSEEITSAGQTCPETTASPEEVLLCGPGALSSSGPVLRLRLVEDEDNDTLEGCLRNLKRMGLTEEDAIQIIEDCEGDVERVKSLYSVDSDGQQ
eukprot:TRINITY_DN13905_c0_g1_i4.p1 TRINITY_DN13905_c0_g1~~TRINITY_DN13905_c0_g1_i4.p1  ORF type:complete len:505 (+),score=77.42 TRINITY_DN13905_c0_g1_i4:95-1609(+)